MFSHVIKLGRAVPITTSVFRRQLDLQLRCGNGDAILRGTGGVEQVEPASDAGRTVLPTEEHDRPFRYRSTLMKAVARPLPLTGPELSGRSDSETQFYRQGRRSVSEFGFRIQAITIPRAPQLPKSERGQVLAAAQILDGRPRWFGARPQENGQATKRDPPEYHAFHRGRPCS